MDVNWIFSFFRRDFIDKKVHGSWRNSRWTTNLIDLMIHKHMIIIYEVVSWIASQVCSLSLFRFRWTSIHAARICSVRHKSVYILLSVHPVHDCTKLFVCRMLNTKGTSVIYCLYNYSRQNELADRRLCMGCYFQWLLAKHNQLQRHKTAASTVKAARYFYIIFPTSRRS